jgi:small subunit ribosomal protein S6
LREFEALYILKADLSPEDAQKEIKAVEAIVTGAAGEVIEHTDWGKKRLAYAIAKQRYGQYVLFRFRGDPVIPGKMTRHFRYNESVLKGMVVLLDGAAGYVPGSEGKALAPSWGEPDSRPREWEEKPYVQPE